MKESKIGWTDFSGGIWNIVTGCTPADRSCAHCYARAIYERFGRDFDAVVDIWPDKLARWSEAKLPPYSPKRGAPHRPMVFVVDMGDLFHEIVPDALIEAAFGVMLWRKDVIWQVLTKRPQRMARFVTGWLRAKNGECLPGWIWLGTSICDQPSADERVAALLAIPARVRFVSAEPLLAPVDLRERLGAWAKGDAFRDDLGQQRHHAIRGLDWVICGGESGSHRRPFDVTWALDLYEQCRETNTPFFYKQGSALRPGQDDALPGVGQVKEWPG